MLSETLTFAQEKPKAELNKDGDLTIATYYHDNGAIEQQGSFNKEGDLHGVWTSYDIDGNKVTVGNYVNGKKVYAQGSIIEAGNGSRLLFNR